MLETVSRNGKKPHHEADTQKLQPDVHATRVLSLVTSVERPSLPENSDAVASDVAVPAKLEAPVAEVQPAPHFTSHARRFPFRLLATLVLAALLMVGYRTYASSSAREATDDAFIDGHIV